MRAYCKSHRQIAKAAVAKTAVMEVEINNESAASLNQSVTAHHFQSARLPRQSVNGKPRTCPTGLIWWPTNLCIPHPLGLFGSFIPNVASGLAVVRLLFVGSPLSLRWP